MDPRNISGSLKAAILIRSLGSEVAGSIFDSLSAEEKLVVQRHLDEMGAVSADVAEYVTKEIIDTAAMRAHMAQLVVPPPKPGYPGENEVGDYADGELEGMKAIESLTADDIYELIKDEHPQTIAIIIIHLKTPIASDVLSQLSDDIKTDVSIRVATLDKVNAEMVEEVNIVFKEVLKNKKSSVANISGGIDRLAEILNQTDEISNELILNEIEENNPDMAAQIKQKMFVFEDLILVNDRGFQKLLRKVEATELAIALKAASEEVKDKVFRNMSQRAGTMLQEEIDDLGPVRMKEVFDAQGAITHIIQEMEAKGEIIISGRRGEEIIT